MKKAEGKKESKMEKRNERDRREDKHIHAVLYFLLGILLSTCITVMSIVYAVPKITVRTEGTAVSAVTSELVEDTVKASLGDYLTTNKIAVSDESMASIAEYITDSVNNSNEFTQDELWEVKNLIKVSVQGAQDSLKNDVDTNAENTNNNINNSVTNMQEFVVDGDNEISNALKDYIDNIIVPGINESLEMNTEDIVNVNRTIVQMGNSYSSYMTTNDTNLEEIVKLVEDTQTTVEENKEELTEKISDFRTEYDNYVKVTDEQIAFVNEKLGEYVTIIDFEIFKESYSEYKENMEDTVGELQDSIEQLDEQKADKTALEDIAANVNALKSSYDNFIGENGDFEALKDRVISTETNITQNSNNIVALQNRITELENEITRMESANSDNLQELETRVDATLEEKFSKFYQVGSVYLTFGNENPADLYGGTWEKVEDTFLMAAGNQYSVGSAGGSNTVTLGARNIPSLNVTGSTAASNVTTSTNGEHTHLFSTGGTALVVDSLISNSAMSYGYGYANAANGAPGTIWFDNHNKNNSDIASAGNHNHTVNIPALSVTAMYQNDNVQNIDVTNKYVAVNVWKRVA